MAKKGSVGEYICDHCGSTNMRVVKYQNKSNGVTRIHLICNKCNEEDFYDSCDGG